MIRFERRLGGLKSDNSPRPGIASCKLPSRNSVMLENMSNVNELVKNGPSNIIDDVSAKNKNILKKLSNCKNPTERILLNHELRLNTIELNIDCLNNLEENSKNNEHYQEKIAIQEEIIIELQIQLNKFEKKLCLLESNQTDKTNNMNDEKIIMDIKDIVKDSKLKIIQEEEIDCDMPTFE